MEISFGRSGTTHTVGVGVGKGTGMAGSGGKVHEKIGLWIRSYSTRGKAKGAGGLDSKSVEAFVNYVNC